MYISAYIFVHICIYTCIYIIYINVCKGKGGEVIKGPTFTYHGDESTVPSEDIALAFARRLPYTAGMPGPSFTWSAFANRY
jgi:hypothetical protein